MAEILLPLSTRDKMEAAFHNITTLIKPSLNCMCTIFYYFKQSQVLVVYAISPQDFKPFL